MKDSIAVKGSFRIVITEDGFTVGDSGWQTNQVVNLGFNDYICGLMATDAASKRVTHVALGTGTQPAAAGTSLEGEVDHTNNRTAVTAATSSNSKKVRYTATIASSDSYVTASVNISNIGLFNTSTRTTGTIFAGNTYTSSALATNQNVNVTYDIDFS